MTAGLLDKKKTDQEPWFLIHRQQQQKLGGHRGQQPRCALESLEPERRWAMRTQDTYLMYGG